MEFIAHNILLSNGTKTRATGKLLNEKAVMQAIKRTIHNFIPESEGTYKHLRAVDLGCMEGGYAVELARMGFQTLGIDARKENLLKANYIKLNTGLPNLNFSLDDVRNLSKYGSFDLTLCFGILYHLNDPYEFIETLYQQTSRIAIIHTFYAPHKDLNYSLEDMIYKFKRLFTKKPSNEQQNKRLKLSPEDLINNTSYVQHIKNYRLGSITSHKGYKGRWFKEWEENRNRKEIEKMPGAAYNNSSSFWFCKKDLIKALYDAGFSSVYEQHDDFKDVSAKNPGKYYGRVLLVATKNT